MKTNFMAMPREDAETVALRALGFIASEEARLTRFMADTGISLETLHLEAGEPHVMAAVLDTLLRNEPDLLMFSANAGFEPDAVMRAHHALTMGRADGRGT